MDGPRMSPHSGAPALSSVETQSRRATVLDSLLSDLSSHLEFIVLLLCKSFVVYGCYKALCSRCSLLFHLRL